MQGASEGILSALGLQEAALTAAALKGTEIGCVYSSPQKRALQTADLIAQAHHVQPVILDDLREMDFGFYEGKPYFASPEESPKGLRRLHLLSKVLVAQVSGESLRNVSRRATSAWRHIMDSQPYGPIVIVSHGVLLNYLLACLLPKSVYETIKPVSLRPCSITELDAIKTGSANLLRLNDINHLTLTKS
jgi:broad specificity phosphatase PhoE